MVTFLLETYAPRGSDLGALRQAARAAATASRRRGASAVTYVQTVYVEEDETCFHLFDAVSAAAVVTASRAAPLQAGRVVTAALASALSATATASEDER